MLLVGVLGGLLRHPDDDSAAPRADRSSSTARLKYPEGTACAEVLKAGANAQESLALASPTAQDEMRAAAAKGVGTTPVNAKTIFAGFAFVGLALQGDLRMSPSSCWQEMFPRSRVWRAIEGPASISAEISPEMTGVGYIIGPRDFFHHCAAGGVLSVPGSDSAHQISSAMGSTATMLPPGTKLISEMSPHDSPQRLRPLYWRRGGGGGRPDHQPGPSAADDLAWA